MKPVEFHPEAEEDLLGAVEYYESKAEGLGASFLLEATEASRRVQESPQLYPIQDGKIRRCLLPRFPYGLLYAELPEFILVVAVMHLRRRPGYWKDRV